MSSQPQTEDTQGFSYTFKQQIMKAWQPVPTLDSTIVLFCILTIFFLVFGIVLLSFSNQIKEYSVRYDSSCTTNPTCSVNINVKEDMDGPVFVYYELDNFYQNHRRYVQSRSIDQLQGDSLGYSDISTDCDPVLKNQDTGRTVSIGGSALDPQAVANPCGLIAKSYFNDTFALTSFGGTEYAISGQNIAWPSDKQNKFKRNANAQNIQWIDVEDGKLTAKKKIQMIEFFITQSERFMVWMRTAALPYFRKLWGRIQKKVPKGEYRVDIVNRSKTFVLSTANAFGGQNEFLAIAYLVVGAICCVISLGFIIKRFTSDKPQKT